MPEEEYQVEVIGSGRAVPSYVMKNEEFESFLETSDEWIRTRTGISERRIIDPKKSETTFSLALEASKAALEKAKISAKEVELILVGTITPDTVMPNTANFLQAELGCSKAFGFDLQAACAGFLYGLSVAEQYLRCGTVETALVVGVETLSTVVNWRDRSTCVLFGDGAGAVVVQRKRKGKEAKNSQILGTDLFSDGSKGQLLCIPGGASKLPPYRAEYRSQDRTIHMQGSEIFKLAIHSMLDSSKNLLKKQGLQVSDLDYVFFHQANIRIIEHCQKVLGIPLEKTWINIERYGNTSAATLPIALDEAWQQGAIQKGDLILLTTFGGGLTWGSSLIRL